MTRVLAFSVLAFCACCAAFEADTEQALQPVGVKGAAVEAPGLDDAVATTWGTYSRVDLPPHVLLVTGADLSCTDPASLNPGFSVLMASGMDCREGYTLLPFAVSIAFRGQPWSQSALAHELMHVDLIRSGRGTPLGDPAHVLDVWQLGGAVDQANSALVARGL